jgi:hypothetical protein
MKRQFFILALILFGLVTGCLRLAQTPNKPSEDLTELGSGGTRIGSPLVTNLAVTARLLSNRVQQVQFCLVSAGLYRGTELVQPLSNEGLSLVAQASLGDFDVSLPGAPQQEVHACGVSEFSNSPDECGNKPKSGGFLRSITVLQDLLFPEQVVSVDATKSNLDLQLSLAAQCPELEGSLAYRQTNGTRIESTESWTMFVSVNEADPRVMSTGANLSLELDEPFFQLLESTPTSAWETEIRSLRPVQAYWQSL